MVDRKEKWFLVLPRVIIIPFSSSMNQELASKPDFFSRVVLIGRRQVELPSEPGYAKMVRYMKCLPTST